MQQTHLCPRNLDRLRDQVSACAYDRKAVRYVYFAGDNKSIKTGLSVDFGDSAILVAITIYQFELP